MRDLTYPPIIATCKVLFRGLGLRFHLVGTENVPRTGGALLAFNHVSYVDFIFGGFAAQPSGRLVRFMAKRELFDHPVGGSADALDAPHLGRPRRRGGVDGRRRCDYLRRGRGGRDLPRGDDLARPSRSRSSSPGRPGSPPRPAFPWSRWCCGAPSG